eukprot:11071852-Heterocapsa_arctica.AAC.1
MLLSIACSFLRAPPQQHESYVTRVQSLSFRISAISSKRHSQLLAGLSSTVACRRPNAEMISVREKSMKELASSTRARSRGR